MYDMELDVEEVSYAGDCDSSVYTDDIEAYKIGTIAVAGIATMVGLGIVGGSFYRVKENEDAVIKHFDGSYSVEQETGLYFKIPFFESVEKVSTRETMLYFPTNAAVTDGGDAATAQGILVNPTDRQMVEVTGKIGYVVEDARKWAVDIENPQFQLHKRLDGLVRTICQEKDSATILNDRSALQQEIYKAIQDSDIEEKFGVSVSGFEFGRTGYTDTITRAIESATALERDSAARLVAEQNKAAGIRAAADAEQYAAMKRLETQTATMKFLQGYGIEDVVRDSTSGEITITYGDQPVDAETMGVIRDYLLKQDYISAIKATDKIIFSGGNGVTSTMDINDLLQGGK